MMMTMSFLAILKKVKNSQIRIHFQIISKIASTVWSSKVQQLQKNHELNINPLKCSGIRCLHLKLFNAIQI